MKWKLQLELAGHERVVKDFKFTPLDVAITEDAAHKFQEFIALVDAFDQEPGDNELDAMTPVKIGRFKFGFITIGEETVDVHATLRVKPAN
jgi:hypothetical protein